MIGSLVLLATAYTNLTQLLNVPLSRDVVTNLPTADYSTPQKTILSFSRAAVLGDFTNMYNCCTVECNREDLEVNDLSDVSDDIVRQCRINASHDPVEKCVLIDVRNDSPTFYKVVCRYQALRPDNTNSFERIVFEVHQRGGTWKISRWEPLLPGASE